MKKLNLKLDDLKVDSFGTTPVPRERGTVRANSGCAYTDVGCTEYWSTCPSGPADTDYFCPVTGQVSCGCDSGEPETCAWPCRVSDLTNCHRC
jgi:hypothetical protein